MPRELSTKEKIIQRNQEIPEKEIKEKKILGPILPASLGRILKEQGLLGIEKEGIKSEDSPKAKRSKRYYIRKRINSGKPYIPREIRALGKEKAREMGYSDWERRVAQREEVNKDQNLETLNKLRTMMNLIIKTRMKYYLERLGKK